MSRFDQVGIVGAGMMGSGIAQVSALAGYPTILQDTAHAALQRGRVAIERSLGKLVEKSVVTSDAQSAALALIRFTTALDAVSDADLVIEAVTEDRSAKRALFETLDAKCRGTTVFASNTSSLVIADLAAATKRPDRVLGLHFFNPVPLMSLVEVVRSVLTAPTVVDRAVEFVRSLGKEPVVARDTSGFVVNRLLIPYMLDAIRAVEHDVASVTDIDTAMRLGAGHPMGPLTLLDMVGLDTVCQAAEHMYEEFREARFAPPPLLRRLVTAGRWGRKSGQGFYRYDVEPPVPADLGI